MINVAICDDDISVAGRIERMLQNIAKRNFIDIDTEEDFKRYINK